MPFQQPLSLTAFERTSQILLGLLLFAAIFYLPKLLGLAVESV